MKRALALVALVALGALVATLWSPREVDGPPAPPDSASPSTPVERSSSPVRAPVPFDAVPAAHRPDAVRTKVPVLEQSLRTRFPHAAVTMHDTDCTSAPCILGFDYDAVAVAAADGGARGFQQAVRAAFEAELGYPVTSMHIEDAEAGPRIRMFAVPQEVERSDPLRNRLVEDAHRRQAGPGAN